MPLWMALLLLLVIGVNALFTYGVFPRMDLGLWPSVFRRWTRAGWWACGRW
jgi:hypothetical protein